MHFQKTLIYKKAKHPPVEDIITIAKEGRCVVRVGSDSELVVFNFTNNTSVFCFTAFELYKVIIDIIIKYPFSEYPFEQDHTDFMYECGEPVEGPDDLN